MIVWRRSGPHGGATIRGSGPRSAPADGGLPAALALLLIAGCASQVDPPAQLIASHRLSSALDQLIPGLSDPHPFPQIAAVDRSLGAFDESLVAAAPATPRPPPPRPLPPSAEGPSDQAQSDQAKRPPRPPLPPAPAPPKPMLRRQVAWVAKPQPWPQPAPERVELAQTARPPAPAPPKPNLAAIMPAAGPTLPMALRPPPANPLRRVAVAPAAMALIEPLAGAVAPGAMRLGDGIPDAATATVQIATGVSRAATDAVAVGGSDAGLGALSMAAREALLAGDPATALGLYEQLAAIVPNQRTVLLGRAIALGQLGQHGEARTAYQALLEADPDDLAARTAYLGLLAEVAPEQALHELKQLARRYPRDARLLGQIALAEAGRGDLARAVAALRRAVALDPMNPQHRINLAVMYDRSGQPRAAIEHYRKALAMAMRSGQVTLPLDAIDARLRHLRLQAP